jgi:hypothetical protein
VEVAGGWRRLHKGEVHNLYPSLDIIRVIQSRRMRGAGLEARMEKIETHKIFSSENVKERYHSENLGVDWRIMSDFILGE